MQSSSDAPAVRKSDRKRKQVNYLITESEVYEKQGKKCIEKDDNDLNIFENDFQETIPKKHKSNSNRVKKNNVKSKAKTSVKKSTAVKRKRNQKSGNSDVLENTDAKEEDTVEMNMNQNQDDNHCVICMSDIINKKTLDKCKHSFCSQCISQWFKKSNPICPSCGVVYGEIRGNQPPGQMSDKKINLRLPGYEKYNTIEITYSFPNGIQTAEHPNPGQPYSGTYRTAFLPDNPEGRKVLKLLYTAFDRRLIFTVGRSVTTGCDNTVIWNDVHHKTNPHGGQTCFGYPDPTYLNRVQQELASKGIESAGSSYCGYM